MQNTFITKAQRWVCPKKSDSMKYRQEGESFDEKVKRIARALMDGAGTPV